MLTEFRAANRQHYASLLPESRSGYARSPITHRGLTAGTEYIYRIFPYKDEVFGPPVEVTGTTEPAVAADTRLNLRVVAEGPVKLKLTWDEPRVDGGSDVTGYLIQVANDVDDNRTLDADAVNPWVSIHDITDSTFSGFAVVTSDATAPDTQDEWEIDDADTREYVYQNLEPNDARWFRVIALNGCCHGDCGFGSRHAQCRGDGCSGSAVPVRGVTARASVARWPQRLGDRAGSELQPDWGRQPGRPAALERAGRPDRRDDLEGYLIARKVDDGEWVDDWLRRSRKPRPADLRSDRLRYTRQLTRCATTAWPPSTAPEPATGRTCPATPPTGATCRFRLSSVPPAACLQK